jgi:hypothetical protein
MGFGVGLFADRATKTAQSIAVFSEALTIDVALSASHCIVGICVRHHGLNSTATVRCLSREKCENWAEMLEFANQGSVGRSPDSRTDFLAKFCCAVVVP